MAGGPGAGGTQKSVCPRGKPSLEGPRLTLLALGETLHQDGSGEHSPHGEVRPSWSPAAWKCKLPSYPHPSPCQEPWASLVAQMVEPACSMGDLGSTPGWRRSPGEEHDYLLQHSCLGNLMGKEAWWATVRGVA